MLLCLHVVTEDFLQTFIYIEVGATHYGAKGHLNFAICMAMLQTIAFTAVKMWESRTAAKVATSRRRELPSGRSYSVEKRQRGVIAVCYKAIHQCSDL